MAENQNDSQQISKENPNSNPSGTNPEKVKQEIQKDVSNGVGSMTAREAGSMRD
ncbi:hypothetical protein [Halobacillus massiliensis]|uniref:hypothetical protein n=1 Tax=Halobacillus massiliensis TaxID=1926286 RepID=UPI0015C45B16|nr:hypothetical protein [Halobacillus massiliensis]